MEEEKAAAYYDELTRKGEGAARFKQGLGFSSSSSSSSFPTKPSSLSSSFVRASSPSKAADLQKQYNLETIQNKLKKPSNHRDREDRRSPSRERRRRERDGEASAHRHRSSYRDDGDEGRERHRKRRRSRSRSPSRESHRRDRDRGGGGHERERERERESGGGSNSKSKRGNADYSLLIEGYSQMTPAERVKAKMKLQLSQTAAKDTSMGMSTGWERFHFNKDAPLDGDDDDEVEAAEDEASLSKVIGKSFRFSAAEAKREEEVKAAHDQAMFGAPAALSPDLLETRTSEEKGATESNLTEKEKNDNALISDKVLAMPKGSWRDRARRFRNNSGNGEHN